MKYEQNIIVMEILHAKWKKDKNNLSNFTFQEGIQEGGIGSPGAWSPSEIFAISQKQSCIDNLRYNLKEWIRKLP